MLKNNTLKDKYLSNILAPISIGELIDKITILHIKKDNMTGVKKENVENELQLLNYILENENLAIDINLVNSLKDVNNCLWEIEDKLRQKENKQKFDNEFIQLARSVYKENDRRAAIKKEINQKYNSGLIEEKSYEKY